MRYAWLPLAYGILNIQGDKRTEIGLTPFPLLPTLKPLVCIVKLTKNYDNLLKTTILQKAKELRAI